MLIKEVHEYQQLIRVVGHQLIRKVGHQLIREVGLQICVPVN